MSANKEFARPGESETEAASRKERMAGAVRVLLECIGEDPEREGLMKTPERVAKALNFMTHGYAMTAEEVLNQAVFEEKQDEMVIVRDIEFHSLCEHHMVPFSGKVHVGYIPDGKIVGLSKLVRLVNVFARRLQVQERLTHQIAKELMNTLQPVGAAVIIEATHFCMVMRGVQNSTASTVTSTMLGCFREDPKTRDEFLQFTKQR